MCQVQVSFFAQSTPWFRSGHEYHRKLMSVTDTCGTSVCHTYITHLVNLPDPNLVELAEMARQLLPLGMWEADEPIFKPTKGLLEWHNDLWFRVKVRAAELGATAANNIGVGMYSTTNKAVGCPRKWIAFYRSIGASNHIINRLLHGIEVDPVRPITRQGPRKGIPNYSCYQCSKCNGKNIWF